MAVVIRMARIGTRNTPVYKIVAADKRAPRDGSFLEKLGTYNPRLPRDHKERVVINAERVKHWISKGALPTERVAILLAAAGLAEKPKQRQSQKSAQPKAKAQERAKAKAEKEAAANEAAAAPAPAEAPAA